MGVALGIGGGDLGDAVLVSEKELGLVEGNLELVLMAGGIDDDLGVLVWGGA